jgi:four helix bundle protein
MNYPEWEREIPASLADDPLWSVKAYRLALFAADIAWEDISRLVKDMRTRSLADQLYRAIGSVGANIAEGYSRGSNKDRTRFYEYALGSARESRDWYYKARHILNETVTQHRMDLQTEIIKLLLTMIPQQRQYSVHEDHEVYDK